MCVMAPVADSIMEAKIMVWIPMIGIRVILFQKKGEVSMGVLTEKQEKLLVLFKGAIEREREAQKVYSEMVPLNDDPTIKHILEQFIEQERQHEKTLLKIYNDLRTTGEFKDAT